MVHSRCQIGSSERRVASVASSATIITPDRYSAPNSMLTKFNLKVDPIGKLTGTPLIDRWGSGRDMSKGILQATRNKF